MDTKFCPKCSTDLPTSAFRLNKTGYLHGYCRPCAAIDSAKWRDNNRQKHRDNVKIWRLQNVEKRKDYVVAYRNSKDEQGLTRFQRRYQADVQFRLRHNLRARLAVAMKGQRKAKLTMELLGCSLSELEAHLKNTLLPGMSWEMVGTGQIHVDHIRPLASFDLTVPEQQKLACHCSNLQLLWAVDNIRKSDKWQSEVAYG